MGEDRPHRTVVSQDHRTGCGDDLDGYAVTDEGADQVEHHARQGSDVGARCQSDSFDDLRLSLTRGSPVAIEAPEEGLRGLNLSAHWEGRIRYVRRDVCRSSAAVGDDATTHSGEANRGVGVAILSAVVRGQLCLALVGRAEPGFVDPLRGSDAALETASLDGVSQCGSPLSLTPTTGVCEVFHKLSGLVIVLRACGSIRMTPPPLDGYTIENVNRFPIFRAFAGMPHYWALFLRNS